MNDGGPAFPTLVETGVVDAPGEDHDGNKIYRRVDEGMTLRDYFAAQALPMMLVTTAIADSEISNEGAAAMAYSLADCMLAERAK